MALLLEDLLGLPQEVRYRPVEPGLGADAALEGRYRITSGSER